MSKVPNAPGGDVLVASSKKHLCPQPVMIHSDGGIECVRGIAEVSILNGGFHLVCSCEHGNLSGERWVLTRDPLSNFDESIKIGCRLIVKRANQPIFAV